MALTLAWVCGCDFETEVGHFPEPSDPSDATPIAPRPVNPTPPVEHGCQIEVPEALDLGCVLVGGEVSKRVVLVRACDEPTVVTGIRVEGHAGEGRFVLEDGKLPAYPFEVAAGTSVEGWVTYRPESIHTAPGGLVPQWEHDVLRVDTKGGEGSPYHTIGLSGIAAGKVCRGLHVQLDWQTPGDSKPDDVGGDAGADLDLHLMHEYAVGWFDKPFDASWANPTPMWDVLEVSSDDPIVSPDIYDGQGAESIALALPAQGRSYRIGVHYWRDNGYGPSIARVRVFLWGTLVHESALSLVDDDLWEVGEITFPEGTFTRSEAPAVIPDFAAEARLGGK